MKEVYLFETSAVPPYSFALTVHKPAGWWWSTPHEVYEDGTLWTAARIGAELMGLKLKSLGTLMEPLVRCTVFSDSDISDETKSDLEKGVGRALGVDEDISEFYEIAGKDDILRDVVDDLYGMRTSMWPDLFPALILAVTLQMAPMNRSSQMMELLTENYGDKATFDGEAIAHWPSPERIAGTDVEELKAKAKLGYRARNLKAIAESILGGFSTMEELSEMPYEEAKRRLMSLRGVGEYSADIVISRMGFPLDVWSAKIFHVLFFGREPESPRETIPELRRIARERWGKWTGHAFVYVLNDLPNISRRIGFDLTRF